MPVKEYPDESVEAVNKLVLAAKYVRPWSDYSLKYSLLIWLQCLTQSTMEVDMGSIAGDYEPPSDISFIYRFFLFAPQLDYGQRISDIRLQVCDRHGADLLARETRGTRKGDKHGEDYMVETANELREAFDEEKESPYSLDEAKGTFKMLEPVFWKS